MPPGSVVCRLSVLGPVAGFRLHVGERLGEAVLAGQPVVQIDAAAAVRAEWAVLEILGNVQLATAYRADQMHSR